MPISSNFSEKLLPILPDIVSKYQTPFYVYDWEGIKATHHAMVNSFKKYDFKQYFAVKALPNPVVIQKIAALGSGLDCSSPMELKIAEACNVQGDGIVFTSNNTAVEEYEMALNMGALITFDDIAYLKRAHKLPEIVSYRVSPASFVSNSVLMTGTQGTKFGVPKDRILEAYKEAIQRGVQKFGIHGMSCANELNVHNAINFAEELIGIVKWIQDELNIKFDYINFGGGMGIPYYPDDTPFDFELYAATIENLLSTTLENTPKIIMECGRYVTGPHGVLIAEVINRVKKERDIVGINASMSDIMRPGFYKTAYHHISLPLVDASLREEKVVDVVGPLCENMDRFAIDRTMIDPQIGDLVYIQDAGAHCHAMGFNYNGRLRPAELMFTETDEIVEIRRAETYDDYIATIQWNPKVILNPYKIEKQ
jgi:diaminopimelate decarboxylase/decarboxylase